MTAGDDETASHLRASSGSLELLYKSPPKGLASSLAAASSMAFVSVSRRAKYLYTSRRLLSV